MSTEAADTRSGAGLDDNQRRVVDHGPGAVRVLGGPGTGKTKTLEERYVRLALEPGCSPDRVLFLVPNRAQKVALQDRLTRRLLFDEGLEALIEVPVYTWHGLANHLVTRHYDRLAYSEPPVLLTSPEQWGDVRDALSAEAEANWSKPYRHLLRNRGFVDEVVDFCIRAEQRLLEPHELDHLVELRPAWADIVRFFKAHRRRLRRRSRIDYPTLLADATELIANHDDVRAAVHHRFVHVLVDDGQELARVQQRFLRFLTGLVDPSSDPHGRSLVVAADPDSAIETFRGAEPDWLDRFAKDFGSHDTVMLPLSYRLGPALGRRTGPFITTEGNGDHRPAGYAGETTLEVHRYQNLAAEMEAVARSLRLSHLMDGVAYEDMAVLLTSPRHMLPALERSLNALQVPYSISAPDRPLERESAVRAFIELSHFCFDSETDDARIAELLRSPLVGLEVHELRALERDARSEKVPLAEHVAKAGSREHGDPRITELLELKDLLKAAQESPADQAFWIVWNSAAYYRTLVERARRSLDDPAQRELDALVAFSRALGRFVERRRGSGTLAEYLTAIGRADFGSDPWLPPERRSGGVEVLSFHAAKGREWDIVCVSGCVDGAIPKGRRAQGLFDPYFLDDLNATERARRNEAEDRRVFYVAVTRARARCIVTTSPGPSRKGQPSRFLAQLTGAAPEVEQATELPPLTFAEAAAGYRRALANPGAPRPHRLAALKAIARIRELDPSCSAAHPREWWWRWNWTEGAIPINQQRGAGDGEVPENKLRSSYSRISEYDNCGLKYLFSVVLGFDPETSHNMAFGTWIHQIFEDCEKDPTPEQQATGRRRLRNPRMVWERYEQLFDRSVFPNKAIARQFHHDGKVMLERYMEHLHPGGALLAEQDFIVDFDGHRIRGRIDRVDRAGSGVQVIDYKTSRHPIYKTEAEGSLQLAIYYLAAQEHEVIARLGRPMQMKLVYPGHMTFGKVTERIQKPDQAKKALERLPALLDGVLKEDFRPSPEADCTWCKFKIACPLWAEGKEVPA
jgi:superfamily I DNA/RNA helicase/RecB family exonuclease